MISEEDLPESLVSKCLDVLRQLSPSERDLIRVVVEVIHDLRDRTDEEDQAVNRLLGYISVKKKLNLLSGKQSCRRRIDLRRDSRYS